MAATLHVSFEIFRNSELFSALCALMFLWNMRATGQRLLFAAVRSRKEASLHMPGKRVIPRVCFLARWALESLSTRARTVNQT